MANVPTTTTSTSYSTATPWTWKSLVNYENARIVGEVGGLGLGILYFMKGERYHKTGKDMANSWTELINAQAKADQEERKYEWARWGAKVLVNWAAPEMVDWYFDMDSDDA
jgi:hypothetical protein